MPSLWALVRYFLYLGSLGFGGPVALVGYMQRDLVERRGWFSRETYMKGLALSQLAPGPLAAQLAIRGRCEMDGLSETLKAARHREPPTVAFVCLHGAAKSVLAAACFERLAEARGVRVRALAAGTEPDPEIAPAVLRALLAEGIDLRGQRPRRVTPEDLAGAAAVVSFGPDLSALVAPGRPIVRWDDVPALSEGVEAGRAAILARLPTLLQEVSR
jgi:arsenate reductase